MYYAIQCLWHFVRLEFIFISLLFLFYIFFSLFFSSSDTTFSQCSLGLTFFFFFGIIDDMRVACVCACKVLQPLIIYSALFLEEKCVWTNRLHARVHFYNFYATGSMCVHLTYLMHRWIVWYNTTNIFGQRSVRLFQTKQIYQIDYISSVFFSIFSFLSRFIINQLKCWKRIVSFMAWKYFNGNWSREIWMYRR